jgi:outer membrane murein-binding lipoprotein Lpp
MYYEAFTCEVRLLTQLHNSLTTLNTKMVQLQSRVETERTAVRATKM